MAADQRKKRVNASTLVGCTSRDQNRAKRKRTEPPHNNLKTTPNISLEWDSKKKSVVSKREQIGISRRHLLPFVEHASQGHNILADVLSVPRELFQLKTMSEVLSSEVWESHLSEKERSFLSQFLPKEADPDTVIHDLLAGENFHFGNPFLNWGTSLCSGELHPDNVLHKEQSLKASKKAYHVHIRKYHNDMIGNLQAWKEKWLISNDPELDVVQKMWRPRKHPTKSLLPSENRFYVVEENHVATPESYSEKTYSSDNQNVEILQGESQDRKRLLNKKSDSSSSGLKMIATHKQGGPKVHRVHLNIQCEDGAKYMSYIKVSKKQHERVKSSMKHSGNSIQPRSLNSVLGSIDALNVQPFERFEEEEKKKLHIYWLKLARDIPECFTTWRRRLVQRQQITWSLGEELKEKVEQVEVRDDKGKEGSDGNLVEESDDNEEETLPVVTVEKDAEKDQSEALKEQMVDENAACETRIKVEDEKESKDNYKFDEQTRGDTSLTEEDDGSDGDDDVREDDFVVNHNQEQMASVINSAVIEAPNPVFLQDQCQRILSLSKNPQVSSMEVQSHCRVASAKTDVDTAIVSEYPGNLNRVDISVTGGHPLVSNVWPAGDHVHGHGSYYQAAATTTTSATNVGYVSTRELSLGHPQFIQERPMQILDSDSNRQQDKDSVLRRQPNHDMSFFSSYPNQDRSSELLQSLFKGQSSLSYRNEQKQPSLHFQPGNDLLMDACQLSPHLKEQVMSTSFPLDTRQKRLNDLYLHQQENIYSGRGRYNSMMPRQEQLGANFHDWSNSLNAVRMSVPRSQPQVNNAPPPLTQNNWYDVQNNVRDGWASPFEGGAVGHGFSSGGSSNSDQSLYSVLSECNELRPGMSYNNSMRSGDRFTNYSGIGVGIPLSSGSNNVLQHQSANPLNYLSGHEPPPLPPAAMAVSAGLKMNNNNNLGSWMGLPAQENSSGIQESSTCSSMSKPPFLRSWNQ